MSSKDVSAIKKVLKLAKKFEKIEENFNRTLSEQSVRGMKSFSGFSQSSVSPLSSFSYSTTPFLVQEQIMCKIRKEKISPIIEKIVVNQSNVSNQPRYSRKLLKQLKNLLKMNASKKYRVSKKQITLDSFSDSKKPKTKSQKCRNCKSVLELFKKQNESKNETKRKNKRVTNISFNNIYLPQNEGSSEKKENPPQVVQQDGKISDAKKVESNGSVVKEEHVFKVPELPLLKAYKSLTKEPSVMKAPSVPRAPSVMKAPSVTRAPSVTKAPSVKSELVINLEDIHPDYYKQIEDENLINNFKKIELWKTYGNPWINELAELYFPVTFPNQNVVINGSTCGDDRNVWKSPDLSPVVNN